MPIANVQDAREVERSLLSVLLSPDADTAAHAIRALFVETLDFDYADWLAPLNGADSNLPSDARLLARRGWISALYVPLDAAADNQVTDATVSAAAKTIGKTISDELLLLFTNRDRNQLHIIYPDLSGNRPALQRMVAHRNQSRRTVVQQIANLWHDYGVLGKPIGEAIRNAFTGTSDFDCQVFQRMDAAGVTLAALGLKAETGKIQFDKYQNRSQPNGGKDDCRLIWAEKAQRYALAPTVKRAGKEWLNESIAEEGIVTQRITANEQPRRIIATLMRPEDTGTERAYSENHTNFIPLGRNANGLFILAALNSSPVEFLFRRLNSNTQVSAEEINALPFPPLPDDKVLAEIEALVSDLLDWGGVECALENLEQALEHERRLDLLIGSLYGFSPDEVERIRAMLPSHRFVYDPYTIEEDAALLLAMEEADLDDRVSLSEVQKALRDPDECRTQP